MKAKVLQWIQRFEALGPREQGLVVLGAPLLLLALAEVLVFDPSRKQAVDAVKQAELRRTELTALQATLAAQPAASLVPAADQLQAQRDALRSELGMLQDAVAGMDKPLDWGAIVRASASGTPGLVLTQLKTLPTEVVYSPATLKAAASASAPMAKASAPANAASARSPADVPALSNTIYRHRVELSIKGNFDALLGFLRTLQRLPGDLRWDRMQLNVANYPQATVQLTLSTLSTRAETPFN
jgi:MSHA biogenesis protein MshJ